MNVLEALAEQVDRDPGAAAFIEGRSDARTTFGEFWALSTRVAEGLRGRGIGPGDAVLLPMRMSMRLYAVLTALWRLGAVAVFLDPTASRRQVAHGLSTLGTRALVWDRPLPALWALLLAPVRRRPRPIPVRALLRAAGPFPTADVADVPPDTLALVTFTTGSTGLPKALGRTHGLLLAQGRAVIRHLGLRAGQVDLATQPMFVLANLAAGVTTVVPEVPLRRIAELDPSPLVAQIRRCGVTRIGSAPTLLDRIAGQCRNPGTELSGLEHVFVGAAPVFPAFLDRVRPAFPAAEITAVYGSTEAEPVACCRLGEVGPADRAAMLSGAGLLVGRPVAEAEVRILDLDAPPPVPGAPPGPVFQGPGDAGEIVVSAAHVLPGYLHGTGDPGAKFEVDGRLWHRMGDAGYLDPAGRLWLLGRTSARLQDAGGPLYPFQVECAVAGLPGVGRSALAADGGRRVLFVEPVAGGAPDVAAIAARVAWAGVARVVVVKRIPVDRRHNAKVDYSALRALASRGR